MNTCPATPWFPAPALPLQIKDISLNAGGHPKGRQLIQQLSLNVQAGERWVLLGPNGAGKTTLLSALAGLLPPSQGHIQLGDQPIEDWNLRKLAQQRAWCPQFWSDPFPTTAAETVACTLCATHPEHSQRSIMTIAKEWLARFDASALENTDVRTLSGGERQRVSLAAAFAQAAPILLLDEPTAHLDWSHQILLQKMLKDWSAQGGCVITAVHDLNLAWSLATHALLIDGQGNSYCGSREQILTAPHLTKAYGVSLNVRDELDDHGRPLRSFRIDMDTST